MQQHLIEAPTPSALADLVARCKQIESFTVQLTAAEESGVSAFASGLFAMRGVLLLDVIPSEKLPARQARIAHWALSGGDLSHLSTPAIRDLDGVLVIDEHQQVKILSGRTWRGAWRAVALWRNGVRNLSSRDLLEYLAKLVAQAQHRAPLAAHDLHARSEAVAAGSRMLQPDG